LLQTVMVAPLTTNLTRGRAFGNLTLPARSSDLGRDSVVLVCQVISIDKVFFTECLGRLTRRAMDQVDDGLRLALDLRP
jgi:mRNA-degrading endonuclease toxin of MazEF toxin-antitoxin module